MNPTRVRDALSRRRPDLGNALASLFGIITPFCSCSAVPLFIGFLRACVPLGVTFSFLVAAPMVNEIALGMLFAMFGWKIALLYAGTGVAIAFASGLLLGRLRMERYLESWVQDALNAPALGEAEEEQSTLPARFDLAVQGLKEIVGKVWPYILAGIAVGAFIHGYVPESLMAGLLGKNHWYSVPLAVLIGVPLYSNATAREARVQFRAAIEQAVGRMWPGEGSRTAHLDPNTRIVEPEAVYSAILNLSPRDDLQRAFKEQAVTLTMDLGQLKSLLPAQLSPSISMPLLLVVCTWLVVIFFSFPLLAPPNTATLALVVAAFSVAGAIFLILELDRPFGSLIQISSEPMLNALRLMAK